MFSRTYTYERIRIIAQENGTNTTLALSDENRPEGALAYGEAYFCIRAASADPGPD